MNTIQPPKERLLSIDDDIGDNSNELSNVINNPSAEGFFTEVETSVVNSPPP